MYDLTEKQLQELGVVEGESVRPLLIIVDTEGKKLSNKIFNNSKCFAYFDIRPNSGEIVTDNDGNKYKIVEIEWLSVPTRYNPIIMFTISYVSDSFLQSGC